MKKLIVNNQELKLIEAGLELRNATNMKILNGQHPRTTNLFGNALIENARKEKEMIDKLREQIKEELIYGKDEKKNECSSLTMTLKLDTTEFENNLKKLGEKLLAISEV